ncbi:MAG: tetratricopeptide repeat protein [Candidatus Latescibacteria bacterium]|nr:tetratricopeptide repeat protein [Candidatus Latescibacterota bacterium]
MNHRSIHFAAMFAIGLSLISCSPRNPHIVGGNIYLNQGEYDEAMRQFQIAVAEEPNNPDAYMALGKIYVYKHQYEMACQQFDKAIEICPEKLQQMKGQSSYFETVYYNAGIGLIKQEKWEEALNRFKIAARINPDSAPAYNNIVYICGKLNQEEAMLEAYQKARQIDPNNPKPQFNLALYLMTQKHQYDRAAQLLEEVRTLAPQSKDIHRLLGICYSNQKEYIKAEQAFQKAAELDSTNKDVFFNLGIVLIEQGEYQRALAPLKRAAQLDPEDTEALFNIGIVYIMLKDYQKAIDAFTKVIRLQPNNADAYSQRGEAERELGLKRQAYEDFKRAMELKGRK